MSDLVAVVLACAGLLVFAMLEVRRAPRENVPQPPDRRLARALVYAFAAALVLAPVSPAWLLAVSDIPLPVARPETPSLTGGAWHFDFGFGWTFFLFVAVGYALLRLGPVLVAWLTVRRSKRSDLPVPSGRRLVLFAGFFAAVVAALAAGRVALSGARPEEFRTYGALTPDEGAAGRRADAVLGRRIASGARLRPLAQGEGLEREIDFFAADGASAAGLTAGPTEAPGTKVWVAGRPVLIERRADGMLAARPVRERPPEDFPPERRPHFRTMPQWATGSEPGTYVLVEERAGGARFAVVVDESGARPVEVRQVGLLLAAPTLPIFGLLGVLLVAIFLSRRAAAGSPWGGPLRFGAAWLLLETSIATALAYWPYV
jgi:hypothetical protein